LNKKADSSTPVEIFPGENPFILREYNTDYDLYKPYRGMQAEMEIVANSVSVTDFFGLEDDTFDVKMYINLTGALIGSTGSDILVFSGYLSQEDFNETWVDVNHTFKLVATDGIGLLDTVEFADSNGNYLNGTYSIESLILTTIYKTKLNQSKRYFINTLFHDDHLNYVDGANNTPLEQTYLDARAFKQAPNQFDNCQIVLEKINRAFNQTIFQYKGLPMIVRMPEIIYPDALNIVYEDAFNFSTPRTNEQKRFDIQVGTDQEIVPIQPEMVKWVSRPTKFDLSKYTYNVFDEIVNNESFLTGTEVSRTATKAEFTVSNWTEYSGSISSPTVVSTPDFYRREEYNLSTGEVSNNYLFVPSGSSDKFVKSDGVSIKKGNKVEISLSVSIKNSTITLPFNIDYGFLQLDGGGSNKYTLEDDVIGAISSWNLSNSSWSTNVKYLTLHVPADAINSANKVDITLTSDNAPVDGILYFNFLAKNNSPDIQEIRISDFKVNIIGGSTGLLIYTIYTSSDPQGRRNNGRQTANPVYQRISKRLRYLAGESDKYSRTEDIKKSNSYETYLADAPYYWQRGALLKSDGLTLTQKSWAQKVNLTYPGISFNNMNASMTRLLNYRYREYIDINCYGIAYANDIVTLINTIKFPNQYPNKRFAIVNLNYMDFNRCTWGARLLDIYDSTVDTDLTALGTHTFKFEYGS
jgi:hypothetical protein